MISTEDEARDWLRALPEYDPAAEERLEILVRMLAEENTRQNLVSAASLDQVWLRHIVDSAQLLPHVPRGTVKETRLRPGFFSLEKLYWQRIA